MMYKTNRAGIIAEYTDKFAAEAASGSMVGVREDYKGQRRLQKHFIRGLVSDIVDRVSDDPAKFTFVQPSSSMDLVEKVKSVLENDAQVTDEFRLGEIERILYGE